MTMIPEGISSRSSWACEIGQAGAFTAAPPIEPPSRLVRGLRAIAGDGGGHDGQGGRRRISESDANSFRWQVVQRLRYRSMTATSFSSSRWQPRQRPCMAFS